MVRGILQVSPPATFRSYDRARRKWPLCVPKMGPETQVQSLFQRMLQNCPRRSRAENRARKDWISEETWKLVDRRHALRKATAYDKRLDRQLTREVRHAFKVDRRRRCAAAGEAIERALADKKPKQAWQQLQSWYKSAGDRPVKPCREDLVSLTQERIELYRRRTPPGDPIPVMVEEFVVDDSPPSDGEISDAVARLPSGKAAGASGMRVDHFKAWKHEATRDKDPDSSKWDVLVKLVELVYETGTLPAQASWMIVVLLPKPDGGVRGIGLVEALWKLIASVVNARLQSSIVFHDSLHGFRKARMWNCSV